jgi:hypothetical protein
MNICNKQRSGTHAPTRKPRGTVGSKPLWILAAIGVLVAVGAAWWAWETRRRPWSDDRVTVAGVELARDSGFAGSRVCAECHPGESAAFARSGHARTLRPAGRIPLARWLAGKTVADPEQPGRTYHYKPRGDELWVERREAGRVESRRALSFALGSGTHAVTFVGLEPKSAGPPEGLEHHLTYFQHRDAMGVTPGQAAPKSDPELGPDGFRLPKAVLLDCLECHGTRTKPPRGGGVDLATLLPQVSCERCHGPARGHVDRAQAGGLGSLELGMAFGPERETSLQQITMCGRCHRLPEMVEAATIRPDNAAITRFPAVGLLQSDCYVRSGGRVTCTTCHDPHARATSSANPYESACLSCHRVEDESTEPKPSYAGNPCPINPRSDCVRCHMPKRDAGYGIQFSDHWIRAEAE